MLATFSAISTLMSMIQQIHYAATWRAFKETQFNEASHRKEMKGLAFVGASGQTQAALYTIRRCSSCVLAVFAKLYQRSTATTSWP